MEKCIPVVVIKELSETDKILSALKNNGINCAEITFRTACAAEAIAYACKNYPDMSIGAGTVINAQQCEAALAAGAQFIVSPGLSVAVATIRVYSFFCDLSTLFLKKFKKIYCCYQNKSKTNYAFYIGMVCNRFFS